MKTTRTYTDRYTNNYVAFIDGFYIIDLCDTTDVNEFNAIVEEYGNEKGFTAYIDEIRIK